MKHCPHGHRPLIAIDPYGERLIGCLEGNRLGRLADHTLPMLTWKHSEPARGGLARCEPG